MAEVALLLGVLGSAYIASNRKNNEEISREGYRNTGGVNPSKYLPNTNIPTTNYPVIRPNTGSNVNDYKNPNAATDRYYARGVDFDKMSAGVAGGVGGVGILRGIPERGRDNSNDKNDFISTAATNSSMPGMLGNLDTQFGDNYNKDGFTSLTGSKIDPTAFTHNNMAPYYGAKVRGISSGANMHENVLDNKVGGGSQFFS